MANAIKLIIVMAIVAVCAQSAKAQTDGRRPKSLQADLSKRKAEAWVHLRAKKEWHDSKSVWELPVSIHNTSQSPIFRQESSPAQDYTFDVRDGRGKEVSMNKEGKQEAANPAVYKNVGLEIPVGGRLDDKIYLQHLYDLRDSENYVVK